MLVGERTSEWESKALLLEAMESNWFQPRTLIMRLNSKFVVWMFQQLALGIRRTDSIMMPVWMVIVQIGIAHL